MVLVSGQTNREIERESAMTTSPVTQQPGHGERRSLAATIAIALIASSAVLGLLVSGVTFLALAVAFQIAVPIAQQYHVSVSAADVAMAGHIAEFWWVFGAISVASFLAAAVVAVKAVSRLDSAPRG
jgi:uncharacterized oligopeptide transporter (OPT) family protein